MMSKRTQGMLALTLAAGPLLIANTAQAAASCGTPALAAVYATTHHAGVSHTEHRWWTSVIDAPAVAAHDDDPVAVPATYTTVTVVDAAAWDELVVDQPARDEVVVDTAAWTETVTTPAWTETVTDTPAWDETVTDTPAWDETVTDTPAWTETVTDTPAWTETVTDTAAWVEVVVDSPARPAVYQTLYKWVHLVTGAVRWEPLNWNGNSITTSWLVTAESKQGDLVSPATAAVTHTVEHPAVTHTVEHPAVTHTVEHPAVTHTVEHDAVATTLQHPAVTHEVHHDAVTHTVHHEAVTHDEQVVDVPAHTVPGKHHDAAPEVSHVEQQWAVSSPGDQWTDSGETRQVVDQAPYDTQELVTAAVTAGPACPTTGTGNVPSTTPTAAGGSHGTGQTPTVRPRASAASAVPATLAFTGTDTAVPLGAGLLLLFVGSGLTVAARRRPPRAGR